MPAAWWHPRPKKEWEGMPAAWWHPGRSIKPGERIVLLVCPMLSSIPRRLCLCASAARSALDACVSVASSVFCRYGLPGHRRRAVIAAAQVPSGSPRRRHCRRLPWRPCAGPLQMVSLQYLCALLICLAIFPHYIPSRRFCICLRLHQPFSVLEIMVVFLAYCP